MISFYLLDGHESGQSFVQFGQWEGFCWHEWYNGTQTLTNIVLQTKSNYTWELQGSNITLSALGANDMISRTTLNPTILIEPAYPFILVP